MRSAINRRHFIAEFSALTASAYAATSKILPGCGSLVSSDIELPNITHGIASGDVSFNRATVWSRADRPSRMLVEVATDEQFKNARRITGAEVLAHHDFAGKVQLSNLPKADLLFYRVQFQDLDNPKRKGAPLVGTFKPANRKPTDIRFAWSGDTAGQGFGIDESRGGMQTYAAIQKLQPDFFVHSGDVCYADNPFSSEVKLDDGSVWRNVVTEGTSKVAETLDEFRANFRYNLLDKNLRSLNAAVPVFAQWDDHETVNNWYPGEQLADDDRYSVKSAALLAARAKQAFFEYLPIRTSSVGQIYRKIARGPMLDLFFLDLRSFRGKNSDNDQTKRSPATAYLGNGQLQWLKHQLRTSKAKWKFICSDMPIGLIVGDGDKFENCSNGDGSAAGRELEIAELLRFIKAKGIKNVVFITADVHYAASHYYDPEKAVFQDFNPFWEFVSGPLHAGTFGPNQLDNTFGPQVKFNSVDQTVKPNRPPSEGLQFFGMVDINAESGTATVTHYNRAGEKLSSQELQPSDT